MRGDVYLCSCGPFDQIFFHNYLYEFTLKEFREAKSEINESERENPIGFKRKCLYFNPCLLYWNIRNHFCHLFAIIQY